MMRQGQRIALAKVPVIALLCRLGELAPMDRLDHLQEMLDKEAARSIAASERHDKEMAHIRETLAMSSLHIAEHSKAIVEHDKEMVEINRLFKEMINRIAV